MNDDLINQKAFSVILGVSTEMVRHLRFGKRPGPPFPAPAYTGREMLWRREDVLAYEEERKKYLEYRKLMIDTKQPKG